MADTLEVAYNTIIYSSIHADRLIINGVAGETYTVLAIQMCHTGATEVPQVSIFTTAAGGSGTRRHIFKNVTMPPKSSFEHKDKIIIEGTDELYIVSETGDGDIDTVVTYLKQTS